MAKHNFGVIKATFTNYLNESENLHAKEQFGKFMKLIKESASLRAVFEVYKNLESKYIPNEALAIKYIDENINKIKSSTTLPIFTKDNNAINTLMEGLKVRVSAGKEEFYNHINSLIVESLKSRDTDVDQLHESWTFVLDYIKNNKPKLSESALIGYDQIPKEFLVRKAIEKFNTRFAGLNESDKEVFKSIISNDTAEKQRMFESMKTDTLGTLKTLVEDNQYDKETLTESIKRLDEMKFSFETYTDDILKLNELKSDITQ